MKNIEKLVFALLTVFFMISCEKEDNLIVEDEQLEVLNTASKRFLPEKPDLQSCEYVTVKIEFGLGSNTDCNTIINKINAIKEADSFENINGCAKYIIPQILYYDCEELTTDPYVEYWTILKSETCAGDRGIICPGAPLHQKPLDDDAW